MNLRKKICIETLRFSLQLVTMCTSPQVYQKQFPRVSEAVGYKSDSSTFY